MPETLSLAELRVKMTAAAEAAREAYRQYRIMEQRAQAWADRYRAAQDASPPATGPQQVTDGAPAVAATAWVPVGWRD